MAHSYHCGTFITVWHLGNFQVALLQPFEFHRLIQLLAENSYYLNARKDEIPFNQLISINLHLIGFWKVFIIINIVIIIIIITLSLSLLLVMVIGPSGVQFREWSPGNLKIGWARSNRPIWNYAGARLLPKLPDAR